jgi:hypothetical protein
MGEEVYCTGKKACKKRCLKKFLFKIKLEICFKSKGEGNALGRERCKKGNRSHNVWEIKLIVFLNVCLLNLPINFSVSKF